MRSISWRAIMPGMSAGVPMIAGLTIRSPIRDASSSMKPMTRVGEVVLVEDLPRHLARGLAGADDEDALLHLERAGEAVEEQAPAEDADQEHEERRDEDAVADHQRRDREVERREDDRGGADRLQQADDQLAVRVDEREVVEVVVVEAQLADDRDQRDLPEAAADTAVRLQAAASATDPKISSSSPPKTVRLRVETYRLKSCMTVARGAGRTPAPS